MAQDSLQFKEVASLATRTVLNAQEISTNVPAVSQDTQLTLNQEDASLKLSALTARSSVMDNVSIFVMPDSSSIKASASMEDVSLDTLRIIMEDVPDSSKAPDKPDLSVNLLSSSSMDSALELVQTRLTLTTLQDNVFPAQPTVTLASATLSVLPVLQAMNLYQASVLPKQLGVLPNS